MNLSTGIIFGLIGMLGWGVADFFATTSARKVGEYRTFFWSQFLGLLMMTLYFLFFVHTFSIGNLLLILALAALLDTIAYIFFYRGLSIGLVSIVSPVASSWAMITVILSLLFLNESLKPYQLIAILVIIAGIFLASTNIDELLKAGKKKIAEGAKEGLVAMLGWGIMATFVAYTSRKIGWFMPIFVMRIFIILSLASFMAADKKDFKLPVKSPIFLIALIGILDVLAFLAYSYGVVTSAASIVSPITAAFPVVTIILAWIFFKEKLSLSQKMGVIGILAGLVILALKI